MRGAYIFVIFSSLYACLLALSIVGVQFGQAHYVPADPRHTSLFGLSPAKMGQPIPASLTRFAPQIVAVHTDCLSCSVADPMAVKQLFSSRDVLNVVVAPDFRDYRAIEKSTPGANVIYLQPEDIKDLAPQFGPCLYRFDRNLRLIYVQPSRVSVYAKEDLIADRK